MHRVTPFVCEKLKITRKNTESSLLSTVIWLRLPHIHVINDATKPARGNSRVKNWKSIFCTHFLFFISYKTCLYDLPDKLIITILLLLSYSVKKRPSSTDKWNKTATMRSSRRAARDLNARARAPDVIASYNGGVVQIIYYLPRSVL